MDQNLQACMVFNNCHIFFWNIGLCIILWKRLVMFDFDRHHILHFKNILSIHNRKCKCSLCHVMVYFLFNAVKSYLFSTFLYRLATAKTVFIYWCLICINCWCLIVVMCKKNTRICNFSEMLHILVFSLHIWLWLIGRNCSFFSYNSSII